MTRQFALLESFDLDTDSSVLTLRGGISDPFAPEISLRREGVYLLIAGAFGVVEIALRLHYDEVYRALHVLHVNDGLTTTRQIGTGQAYLGIGLKTDDTLTVQLVIVGDATGHLRMNFQITPALRIPFMQWIEDNKR